MTDYTKMTCHCGSVEIRLTLPNGIENVGRCSCSICSRKYAAYVGVDLGNLEVLKGESDLQEYTFHAHSSKHYFCSVCGIHTHHQSRMTPSKYVVNLSCIEGVKIEDYAGVDYFNGREHPRDAT